MSETPTPEEFTAIVRRAITSARSTRWHDTESYHRQTDALMEETLSELGYGVGVDLIRGQLRWYS